MPASDESDPRNAVRRHLRGPQGVYRSVRMSTPDAAETAKEVAPRPVRGHHAVMGGGTDMGLPERETGAPSPRAPRRHLVVGMTFAACVIAYTDRVNISVAAVAMQPGLGWSETQKGFVFSAFFLGYFIFMLPGGILSTLVGGRLVLGLAVLAWSAFTLLTPPAAADSLAVLMAARFGMGLGEAAMFPGAYELFGRWVPPGERARASARMLSGIAIGTIVGQGGSAWLVADFGWPAAFYAFGLLGVVWVVIWFRTISNDPLTDPRVGEAERALLPSAPPGRDRRLSDFKSKLLTRPVLAIVAAHFALTWVLYVLLSWLPSYFHSAQHLTIKSAGIYAALPWAAQFATSNAAAVLSDRWIASGAPATRVRKVMQCGSLILAALMLLALKEAHSAAAAEALLCAATGAIGISWAGFAPAMLDVAPRRSALLYGFSNTIATIPGFVGVTITGWLVDVTGGHYAASFALAAGICLMGALAFGAWFEARPVID